MSAGVPRGWQLVELGRLAIDGPTNGYSPVSAPDAGGTRSLKLSATTQGRLILNDDTIKHLHESIAADSWAWLQHGDLLVQRSNTAELVGTAAIFDGPPMTYIYPDLMMRLRFADEATTRWVWRYLNSPGGRRFFGVMAAGAAGSMPKISGAKLKAMPIPLPPLPEQRRIADILDKADAIRRKRKEAITLTEELLRSAFLEMFGDPVTNPNGWEVKPLGELLSFLTSGSRGWAEYYADEGDTFLRIQNVKNDRLDLSDVAFVRAPDTAEARRTLTVAGDVLLSITADLGRTAVVTESVGRAFINQHLAILRPQGISPEYLSAFLASEGGQRQFRRLNKGGVKAGLNFDDIRSVRVGLPPPERQRAFAQFKAGVRSLESIHAQGVDDADELFSSLVHRAFRGELTGTNGASKPQLGLFDAGGR